MEAVQIKDFILLSIAIVSTIGGIAGVWAALNSRITKLETKQDVDDQKFTSMSLEIEKNKIDLDKVKSEIHEKMDKRFDDFGSTLRDILASQTKQFAELKGLLNLAADNARRHEDEINRLRNRSEL